MSLGRKGPMNCAEGLLACLQMHLQAKSSVTAHHVTEETNHVDISEKSLLLSLVDVVAESLTEHPEFLRFKNTLRDTLVKEIRETVHQHVDDLIKNRDAVAELEDEVRLKNMHIEKLELTVFELQAVLRLKMEELRQLNGESDYSGSICDSAEDEDGGENFVYPADPLL